MRDENLMTVVTAMVKLSESYGKHLYWSALIDAAAQIAEPTALRWAVDDLVEDGILEITPKGLRFALD